MEAESPSQVTQLLHAVAREVPGARDQLWQLVYDELHNLAQRAMAMEHGYRTLQTTILIHEAFVRLGGDGAFDFSNRRHFFTAAAIAMRRILVDDARRRGRAKRGGRAVRRELDQSHVAATEDPTDLIAIDEALTALANEDAQLARVVELRYFCGLSIDDTATALGVSPRKIDKDWRVARAWLHRRLSGDGPH